MSVFWKAFAVVSLPALLFTAVQASSQQWPDGGNPATGATLYDQCVPCHTLNGNGLAGKNVQTLMTEMKNYQTGTYTAPKVVKMQEMLQKMSDAQLLDLAAYIAKM